MPDRSIAGALSIPSPPRGEERLDRRTWAELLHSAHAHYADERAVKLERGWLSYRELLSASMKVSAWLSSMNVEYGARIVLALNNCPEMIILERSLALWGWIRVAISPRLHPEEIDYITADCGASVVFCEERIAKALKTTAVVVGREGSESGILALSDVMQCAAEAPAYPDIAPEDLASLMYTSGTTGRPKAAMNTHRAWYAMATRMRQVLPAMGPGDILMHAAPMSHFSGSVAAAYAISGAAIATISKFDASKAIWHANQIGATCLPLVPTMLNDILRSAAEVAMPTSLRVVPYGGSSVSADTLKEARAILGDVLVQIYGMSEALIPVTSLGQAEHRAGPDENVRLRSAGQVAIGVEVRLSAETDGIGEIQVRGENVMTGYWNNKPQTQEVLDSDGWYSTGDLGAFRDGFLEIVGRRRDVIISGGFNVYPAEVERVIQKMKEVAEVAVVGVPDSRWGEAVVAMIALKPGATLTFEAVVAVCREHLAGYKKPLKIEIVLSLPKTSTGKTDKNTIRKMLATGLETTERSPGADKGNGASR